MAIYAPGMRSKGHGKIPPKRNLIGQLSLTAMVDMFTVLTIFLLQNYQIQDVAIELKDNVQLPKASSVKDLTPSIIVIVTPDDIMVNNEKVASFTQVKEQKSWLIPNLQNKIQAALKTLEEEHQKDLKAKLQQVVNSAKAPAPEEDKESWKKVTLQADKNIDFLSIKKVMYSLTEAGAAEINFAVIKKEKPTGAAM